MRITDFQIAILNSLRCVRINEEDSILREVENFSNHHDFGCTLLCQPVDSLIEASKDFYNDFNPDSDTI